MIAQAIGHLLRNVRADERKMIWNHPAVKLAPATIQIISPAFSCKGSIPMRYAGRGVGQNISPPLLWSGVPASAAELVLILEDPDAPLPKPFVHMIATGIAPSRSGLQEGELNAGASDISFGRGTFGDMGYSGPRALRSHGPHRYVFEIFALNSRLSFSELPKRKTLLQALQGRVIARGSLTGIFERE